MGKDRKHDYRVFQSMSMKSWSNRIAALTVDALVDQGLIRQEDFERGVNIVSEEILVRLSLNDYPTSPDGGIDEILS